MVFQRLFVEGRRLASRLEETRILPYRFLTGVSGDRGKRRIHVLNFPAGVGDDNAIGGLLHGRRQAGPLHYPIFRNHAHLGEV